MRNFDSTTLLSEIKSCFNNKDIESFAKESGFVRRSTSKLTGRSFLMMNIFDTTDGKERSLNDSCDWLEDNFEITMSKQSLDERYNTNAVSFMRMCFNKVLKIVNLGSVARDLDLPFSKIQLLDSTSFRIPDHLSTFYKGWDGQGGNAILKIHLNYDFLNGEIEDIFLTDGCSTDTNYKFGKNESIIPKALYIRDLGYFDLDQYNKIDKEGGYFLSRSKTSCTYYKKNAQGKFERIDILDYLPKEAETTEVGQIYLGGKKQKTKARLIIQGLPQEIVKQKQEQLKRWASKHPNTKVSEHRKAMCRYGVYITNTLEKDLPTEKVRLAYTLRWQIEILFKVWKSIFNIDQVKKMSIFRFECYIYSKLISILLTLHVQNKLGQYLWEEQVLELSPLKASKLIKKNGQL